MIAIAVIPELDFNRTSYPENTAEPVETHYSIATITLTYDDTTNDNGCIPELISVASW